MVENLKSIPPFDGFLENFAKKIEIYDKYPPLLMDSLSNLHKLKKKNRKIPQSLIFRERKSNIKDKSLDFFSKLGYFLITLHFF